MDFKRNPHFLDNLVIGETAKMVMKVARKVLKSMNQISRNRVVQFSGMSNNIMILGQGSINWCCLK